MNTKKMNIMRLLGVASCLVAFMAVSCTDLEIEETDSIFAESADGFNGVADVKASLENLYGATIGMQGGQDNFYALQEVSSDEYLVPTRGTDWGDNGIWRTLHNHTWDAGHGYVGTVWNQLN